MFCSNLFAKATAKRSTLENIKKAVQKTFRSPLLMQLSSQIKLGLDKN